MNTLQAILKINPNAKVSITQKPNEDEVIEWLDGTTEIPLDQIDAKKIEFSYQEKRKLEYPSIVDQLDDIYHNGVAGWKKTIKAIKDKYPKE